MKKSTIIWLSSIGIAVLVVIIAISSVIGTANSMNRNEHTAETQLSNVQVVMQRRADLIPNLVSAVAGSQAQEQKIYGAIADARTKYYNASSSYKNANSADEKTSALEKQQSALNIMVGSIKENYPNIESNDQMKTLMAQIEGTENRISVERQKYNNLVNEYNIQVTSFPDSIIAGMTNHHQLKTFTADDSAQSAPKIDFNSSSSSSSTK